MEIKIVGKYPSAKVISYDDTLFAFVALSNEVVQIFTKNDAKLVGLLTN